MTMRYPPELVLKVNEVFHDVEGAAYAAVHPEIFQGEAERWDRIARTEIVSRSRPIRVLDVGCGTGFVAERVAPVLSPGDTLVCADLSQAMLDACRAAMERQRFVCRFEFLKLDGKTIAQDDESQDVVTMNSVLHHLPDCGQILREISRILNVSGSLIVAHEPNRRFYESRAMRARAALVRAVVAPRETAGSMLRRVGVMGLVQRIFRRKHHQNVLNEVNRRLLAASVISEPLSQDELTAIVDIQSPTAGGFHADRGIDIETLAKAHLPHFDCRLETYDHLGSGTDQRGGLISRYARRIARKRPADGATLFAILTKRSD